MRRTMIMFALLVSCSAGSNMTWPAMLEGAMRKLCHVVEVIPPVFDSSVVTDASDENVER